MKNVLCLAVLLGIRRRKAFCDVKQFTVLCLAVVLSVITAGTTIASPEALWTMDVTSEGNSINIQLTADSNALLQEENLNTLYKTWGDPTDPNTWIPLANGGYIKSVTMGLLAEPVISLDFLVTAGSEDTTFTITSALLSFPAKPFAEGTASAGVTVTDQSGNGATLTGLYSGKAYKTTYNGETLFANLVSPIVATPDDSNTNTENVPSWQPMSTLSSMQSSFKFTLNAGDIASGTSMYRTQQATVVIETVSVGNPGNPADTTGHGAVNYTYNIGKYDVTIGQYVEYLNAKGKVKWFNDPKGYSPGPGMKDPNIVLSGNGTTEPYSYSVSNTSNPNNPVKYVSYWDACRFVNWLNNGKGDGDSESGAYTLNDYSDSDGGSIGRNPGARWFIPTPDEWYKAAFYDGTDYVNAPIASAYGALNMYGAGTGLEWTDSVSYIGSIAGRPLCGDSITIDFKGSSLGDPSKSGGPVPPGGPEPIDHGGFEFRVASAVCTAPVIGDLNGNCKVDFTDFAIMASHWLDCNLDPPSACW